MKIVFFGTSEFAVESLKAINDSIHEVICVVTQPDSRRDRGHKLHYTPVKEAALELELPIYQSENINQTEAIEFLKGLGSDLFVVVSYGGLLKRDVLSLGNYSPINVHPSLLPLYRGAAPIQRSLMNGDDITGVTIMEMTERLDAGDIIRQKKIAVDPSWNYGYLNQILAIEGSKLLLEVIDDLEHGSIKKSAQNDELHTYAKKIKNDEKYLDLTDSAQSVVNKIRGLAPKVTPLVLLNEHYLGIVEAVAEPISEYEGSIGEVVAIDKKNGILVKCGHGAIWIKKVRPEGKKTMSFIDFVNGKKIATGNILKSKEEK